MTIIASFQGKTAFAAFSDVLITSKIHSPQNDILFSLPARDFIYSPEELRIRGKEQKSIIVDGRHMVMWAGSEIVARSIVSDIRKERERDREIVDLDFIYNSGYSKEELDSVSFIIHIIRGGDHMQRMGHRIEIINEGGVEIWHNGSGSWDLIQGIKQEAIEENARFSDSWVPRLMTALLSELEGKGSSYRLGYGGWYEITVIEAGRFVKKSFTVSMWSYEDGVYSMGPVTMLSWYHVRDLVIARAMASNDGRGLVKLYSCRDWLRRGRAFDTETQSTNSPNPPDFHFHFIWNAARRRYVMRTFAEPPLDSAFIAWLEGNMLYFRLEPEFAPALAETSGDEDGPGLISMPDSYYT